MLKTTLINIFNNTWPMMLIFGILLVLLRIIYLIKMKKKIIFYREVLYLSFVIYTICLFYIVTFQDVDWSTSNYVPFKEIFRYEFGSTLFLKNVIGNMVIFLPYGFFVSYFLKLKKLYLIILLTLLASFSIESLQSIIGRVFDIDDIFLNLIGGLIGFYIYRFSKYMPKTLKNPIFYNIIILLLLMGIIIYLFNIISMGA